MNLSKLVSVYALFTAIGARFMHSQKFHRGTFKLYQHGGGLQANEVLIYEPDSSKDSPKVYIPLTSSSDPEDILVAVREYLGLPYTKVDDAK